MGDISLPALNKGMVGYGRKGALSLREETWGRLREQENWRPERWRGGGRGKGFKSDGVRNEEKGGGQQREGEGRDEEA